MLMHRIEESEFADLKKMMLLEREIASLLRKGEGVEVGERDVNIHAWIEGVSKECLSYETGIVWDSNEGFSKSTIKVLKQIARPGDLQFKAVLGGAFHVFQMAYAMGIEQMVGIDVNLAQIAHVFARIFEANTWQSMLVAAPGSEKLRWERVRPLEVEVKCERASQTIKNSSGKVLFYLSNVPAVEVVGKEGRFVVGGYFNSPDTTRMLLQAFIENEKLDESYLMVTSPKRNAPAVILEKSGNIIRLAHAYPEGVVIVPVGDAELRLTNFSINFVRNQ